MSEARGSASRRRFLAACSGFGLRGTVLPGVLWAGLQESAQERVTLAMVREDICPGWTEPVS